MERALHPDLNKLIFRRLPSKAWVSSYSTYSLLVELLRAGGFGALPPEKRLTEASVLEITDDVACLRIKTAMWCDYLQAYRNFLFCSARSRTRTRLEIPSLPRK